MLSEQLVEKFLKLVKERDPNCSMTMAEARKQAQDLVNLLKLFARHAATHPASVESQHEGMAQS